MVVFQFFGVTGVGACCAAPSHVSPVGEPTHDPRMLHLIQKVVLQTQGTGTRGDGLFDASHEHVWRKDSVIPRDFVETLIIVAIAT